MKKLFVTLLFLPLFTMLCGPSYALQSKEIFGSPMDASLIKIGANEIAQSGILRELATNYIEERKLNYSISWLQDKNSALIKALQNNKIDIALICADIGFVAENGIENKFNKEEVFFNNYVLIGPKNNFAKIDREDDIVEMFRKISNYGRTVSQKIFIGNDLDSDGFYIENKIWQAVKALPNKALWYERSSNSVIEADKNFSYAFVELSTMLDNKKNLKNSYIYSARNNTVKNSCNLFYKKKPNTRLAAFALYMKSKTAQETIANFGKEKYAMPIYNLTK